jgi:hypothetical protein
MKLNKDAEFSEWFAKDGNKTVAILIEKPVAQGPSYTKSTVRTMFDEVPQRSKQITQFNMSSVPRIQT